jgi:5-bromo-4-chloroindolyl phosphate hydrolysis protein
MAGPARRVQALVRRARAWAPVSKAAALFLLPLPVGAAALMALAQGDLDRLALTGGSLACLWGAGVLSWNALAAEARYCLGERLDPPAFPSKRMSAGLTALGAALAALAGGHAIAGALVFALLGAVGYLALFGADIRQSPIDVAIAEGVDRTAVAMQLERAHGRLRAMDGAARALLVPEFTERLSRITGIGQRILTAIARNPRDASRARRFLHLYLDSAERVTLDYVRTHRQIRSAPLEQNFRQLLVEMENTFAEQHRRLLEHDVLSLDVDIEVLNARLKQDGPG